MVKWYSRGTVVGALSALVFAVAFLRGTAAPTDLHGEARPRATYADPFAYCSEVGTIDTPDDRYTGPRVPEAIAIGLRQAFGLPATAPLEPFLRATYWRCMNGQVYACTVGANLPCQEKADTSRTPSAAMQAYCQQNPAADVIPAVVTGRATVYLWRCTEGRPTVVRQVASPDARGFLSHIWYRIVPPDS